MCRVGPRSLLLSFRAPLSTSSPSSLSRTSTFHISLTPSSPLSTSALSHFSLTTPSPLSLTSPSLLSTSTPSPLSLSSPRPSIPVDPAVLEIPVQYGDQRQVWVEGWDTLEAAPSSILDLHPEVWSVYPRMDIIHSNMVWQSKYNVVNYNHVKNTREMIYAYGGGAKPWQQKGTGRARQGSRRAPQWVRGGKAHGPRGPRSLYYMLPWAVRVYGLIHTLSVKMVQDDVHVVEDLELPTGDPAYLTDLVRARGWAPSVLVVDTEDTFPTALTQATEDVPHINLMPVYGLNVNSMIKHETLVLTRRAVQDLTAKLLHALHSTDVRDKSERNRTGPRQLELKMEQHRPRL